MSGRKKQRRSGRWSRERREAWRRGRAVRDLVSKQSSSEAGPWSGSGGEPRDVADRDLHRRIGPVVRGYLEDEDARRFGPLERRDPG